MAIAVVVVGPVVWFITDRTPPFVRLHGTLDPPVVERGGSVRVRYVTTKHARPDSDCPGTVQQEIVDSSGTTYSKRARAAAPAQWEDDPDDPQQEILIGQLVQIPVGTQPGPASFRSASFRHCNWLQEKWPLYYWPIVQIGPDIPFVITCRTDVETEILLDGKRQCVPKGTRQ